MPNECSKHPIDFCRIGRRAVGEHASSVRQGKVPRFPLPTHKKRPLGSHPRGPVPSFDAPSPSSWCSPVRSRRTVRGSSDDRSWFGRPQAIRKGGRECRQQQGDERVENAGVTSGHPLTAVSGAVGAVYELPKKRSGPTRSLVRRIVPSPKGTS